MPPVKPAPPRPAARAARIVKFQAYYPVPRTGTVLPGGAWAHLVTAPAPRLDLSTTPHECEPRQPPPRHLNKWGGRKGRGGALLSTSDHHAFLLSAGAVSRCAQQEGISQYWESIGFNAKPNGLCNMLKIRCLHFFMARCQRRPEK